MTQLEAALKNKITPEMKIVARKENLSVEYIKEGIKSGEIIIPKNINHKIRNICGIGKGLRTKINDKSYEAGLEQWYDKVRRESFDRAISEETKKLLVLVSDYNWKDVGNWKTVYNLAKKDKNGHALIEGENSRIISINAGNCLIIPKQKVISLIGVQDLIVVQTKNELLICDINQSHKVKKAAKIIEG